MRLQFPHFRKAFAFLTIIATLLGPWTNAAALEGNETVNAQAVTALIEVDSMSALTSAIAAVNANPGTEYIISIRDNITATSTFTVSNTAGVTIMSDMSLEKAPFTLTRTGGRHFTVNGSLTLTDVVLDGLETGGGVEVNGNFTINSGAVIQRCKAGVSAGSGGVRVNGTGVFHMNDGAIIQDCYSNAANPSAGGVGGISGCTIVIDGGIIRNNVAAGTNGGGGVSLSQGICNFTMKSGEISGNTATSTSTGYGGGIAAYSSSTVTIEGGTISGNTAAYSGGGVYCSSGVAFTMADGIITGNQVLATGTAGTYYGGGVYATTGAVNITGGTISNNTVAKGNGGGVGIYSTSAMSAADINISGVTISGNTTSNYGGGVFVSLSNTASTTVSVNNGIISKNEAVNGGGIYVASSSAAPTSVTVSGSEISGNKATDPNSGSGGGIYGGPYSTISVYKSTISDNTAVGNSTSYGGGGIFSNTNSSITVDDSKITGNSAGLVGGGIYGYNNSSITVIGNSIVERNEAGRNGGGIYGTASCYINVTDSQITGNRAPNGDGGGIYTADTSYAHIISSGSTIYSGNRARAAYLFSGAPYTDIQSASVSIPGTYVLNNYDINYVGGPLIITYTVTYDANGADGTPPASASYPAGTVVTVAGHNTLFMDEHAFAGWNTWADGSGAIYEPGDTFIITDDVILYAQWEKVAGAVYTLTYDANGASGMPPASASYPAGTVVTIAGSNTLSLTDYTFAGWSDDSGNHYAEGDTFTIISDIVFYAQWNIRSTGSINNNVPGNRIYGVPVTPNYPALESNPGIIEIPEEMPPLAMNPISPNPATGRSKHELIWIAGVCLILSSILLKINAIRKTKERD